MTDNSLHSVNRQARAVRAGLGILGSIVYCLLFLVRVDANWPEPIRRSCAAARAWWQDSINAVLELLDLSSPGPSLTGGLYLFLAAGVLPWLLLSLTGRWRASDSGLRIPNRLGWRIIILGYLVSLPFLRWMADGEHFAAPYLHELRRSGAVAFCLYYFVNMMTEHFLLHGAVLTVCRGDGRWPPRVGLHQQSSPGARRIWQWLGLAQPTAGAKGGAAVVRWLGLPAGCVPAIATSTLLFAAVHWGKDSRELILSLPGGLALAYISYRTNSWLTPFLLHLATAGTACLMLVL